LDDASAGAAPCTSVPDRHLSLDTAPGDAPLEMLMDDRFQLQRFVDAQQPVYETVLGELRAGRKRSHWMWFIFPQIAGLGHSTTAHRFALSALDEAAAHLAHPVLGLRLRECSGNRTRGEQFYA